MSRCAPAAAPVRARRADRGGPARQRGAVGVLAVLVLLLTLVFTALAVDAGRLWYQHRQLQSVADLAALAGASRLGCGTTLGNVTAAAQAAAARNGFTGSLSAGPNLVELGGLTTVAGKRQFNPGGTTEAVHVVATHSVPSSLILGGLLGGTTTLSAQATAQAEPSHATFSVGSYLLRIDTTSEDASLLNALLGGLLGSDLSLDALSYKGLASTDINLADLVRASATIGSVEELLNANVTVADVLNLTATAVGPDSLAKVGLDKLLLASVDQLDVKLGDVLDVKLPSSEAAGKVAINVFDLVTTTIMVANKHHAISMPLGVSIPGILSINTSIDLIEPPQIAVGPAGRDADGLWCTEARTAQMDVKATVQAPVLGLANIDLSLGVQLAQGNAHLDQLDIAPGTAQVVIGATPGIAALQLTNAAGTGPASISALGLTVATIGLNLPIQNSSPDELVYDVAGPVAGHLPVTQSVAASVGDSLGNALSDPHAIDIEVLPGLGLLGGLLDAILDPVLTQVVGPLLGTIGSALLDPLLKLLGIQLGGLDVTVQDIVHTGGARLVI